MKARGTSSKAAYRGGLPKGVGEILNSALRRRGLDQDIARYQFVLHWEEIVGVEVAKRTRPEYLRKGSLVVRVIDSTWAQELSFERHLILAKVQSFLRPNEIVKDIYFVVGDL